MDYAGYMTIRFPDKAFKGDKHFEDFVKHLREDKITGQWIDHYLILKKGDKLPTKHGDGNVKRKTYLLILRYDFHKPLNPDDRRERFECKLLNLNRFYESIIPFFSGLMLKTIEKGSRSPNAVRMIKYDVWDII